MFEQLMLFDLPPPVIMTPLVEYIVAGDLTTEQLNGYAHIIVMFSGGKDSAACVLKLLESGAA